MIRGVTMGDMLIRRLRGHQLLPAGVACVPVKLNSGRKYEDGRWTWSVRTGDGMLLPIGSSATMSECVRAREWDVRREGGKTVIVPRLA